MKLETFFEKFELFADAPDAVKRMRELVLDLAVQGKLFAATNPADWVSIRLGEIIASGLSSVNPADTPNQLFELWSVPAYTATEPEVLTGAQIGSTKRELPDQAILLGKINPHLNRVWVVARRTTHPLIASPEWITITPNEAWDPNYLARVLSSPGFNVDLCSTAQGMGSLTRASTKKVSELEIRRPPLAEQKRILAKVDELMALCDRLEAQQQERQTRHTALARASLARFADAPTPANLDFLFHKSYDISPAELRKAILMLAIQGKLVSQRPNEEPAGHLVKRIAAQRERLAPGKRVKAARRIREIDENKCVHDIPGSWTWCRLGDLVLDFRYGTSRKCDRNSKGVPVLRIPNIQCGRVDASDLKYTNMPSAEFEELRLREGDLLLVRSNGSENLVGRSAVASSDDERFAYAGYLVRARIPAQEVFSAFLHIALSAQPVRDQIEGPIRTTSGVKNINTTELSNLVLPLPPLAEQSRIVAKVNELMSLVDQLEAQVSAARSTAEKVTASIVAELTRAA